MPWSVGFTPAVNGGTLSLIQVEDFKDSELMDLYNAICKLKAIQDYSNIDVEGKFSPDELGAIIRSTRAGFISGNKGDVEFMFGDLDGGCKLPRPEGRGIQRGLPF